jgi:hypothetical protein
VDPPVGLSSPRAVIRDLNGKDYPSRLAKGLGPDMDGSQNPLDRFAQSGLLSAT